MTLAINDVFTPAPSGVGPNPPPTGSWLASLLTNCATVGLSTLAWQSGGVARSILAVNANALALQDVTTSIMAQGGFLDFAATGTATYLDPNTGTSVVVYVTPDPSIPSQWPTPGTKPGSGWLDILADSGYNVQRIGATFANGSIVFTNTSGLASATYQPGTFHVSSPSSGKAYSNVAPLTIAGSGTTTANFQADLAGFAGTAGAGGITNMITSLVGVTCGNPAGFVGADDESNTALAARCRLKIQALSNNGPKGAYLYWALAASQTLQNSQTQLASPMLSRIVQAITAVDPMSGVVTTTVASTNGTVADGDPLVTGVTNLVVTAASNATPIVITTPSTTRIVEGMVVNISGVQGNLGANGFRRVHNVTPTTFELVGSTGNGIYRGGGVIEAGDLGMVDLVLQANAVPLAVTAFTRSAIAQFVLVRCTIYLPSSQAAGIVNAVSIALASYFATVPIGGFSVGVPTAGTMPFDSVLAAIYAVSPAIREVTLLLNGYGKDVAIGTNALPILQWPIPLDASSGVTVVAF